MKTMVDRLSSNADSQRTKNEQAVSNKVFCVFGPEHLVRRVFVYISETWQFQTLFNLAVLASCVILIITPPFDEESMPSPLYVMTKERLDLVELVFAIVFSVLSANFSRKRLPFAFTI